MKRYLVHQIGEEPEVIQADAFTIDGEPEEIRFYRGGVLLDVLYVHALRRPVRELSAGEDGEEEQGAVVLEPSVREDW